MNTQFVFELQLYAMNTEKLWRKERDSNPRNLCRLTRLAVAHNRPLCHLSPHIVNLTKWDYSHQYLTTEAKLTQNRLKFTPVESFEDYSATTLSHITFTFGSRLVDFGKFGAYFDSISVLTPPTVGHMIVQVLRQRAHSTRSIKITNKLAHMSWRIKQWMNWIER